MQYCLNYSRTGQVQGFCRLKIKITQFRDGFRLKPFDVFVQSTLLLQYVMNDELISLWRFELSDSTFSYLITIDTEKWIGEKKREAEPFFKRFIFFFFFPFKALKLLV